MRTAARRILLVSVGGVDGVLSQPISLQPPLLQPIPLPQPLRHNRSPLRNRSLQPPPISQPSLAIALPHFRESKTWVCTTNVSRETFAGQESETGSSGGSGTDAKRPSFPAAKKKRPASQRMQGALNAMRVCVTRRQPQRPREPRRPPRQPQRPRPQQQPRQRQPPRRSRR